jgi:histidine triad (HIT) family protein
MDAMSTAEPSVFERIVARELPATVLFEDDRIIAIEPLEKLAPVHLLVVPKTSEYANVTELAAGDPQLLADIVDVAQKLADEHTGGQYRLTFNTGARVGQTVFHVHAHVLGGEMTEGTLGF